MMYLFIYLFARFDLQLAEDAKSIENYSVNKHNMIIIHVYKMQVHTVIGSTIITLNALKLRINKKLPIVAYILKKLHYIMKLLSESSSLNARHQKRQYSNKKTKVLLR